MRLGYVSVPCSAAVESCLFRLASLDVIDYGFGSASFRIKNEQQLEKLETKNPMFSQAFKPRETLKVAAAMIKYCGGTGVLNAISTAVSLCQPLLVYPITGKRDDVDLRRYYCLQCLPGTTVEHVYTALRHRMNSDFRLEGDFIRAEVMAIKDLGPMRQCGKDMILSSDSCVVKILTNRKISWQSKMPS